MYPDTITRRHSPAVSIHCNSIRGKLDPNLAYGFSMYLEQYLDRHNVPDYTIVRYLPTTAKTTYRDQLADLRKHLNPVVTVFVKCRPVSSGAQSGARTKPLLKSSVFCVNDFPAKLFDFLEFYTVDPMWLTSANQDDYYLIKSGITPVTIDLGVYETVQDTKAITDNFSGIALAVSRALEHNLDNFIQKEVCAHECAIRTTA